MPRKDRALMERAYEEIKRSIIALELAPGKRIDELALCAELQLSRTPVREAIFRLGAEGFVDLGPEGFVVHPLDLLDVAHLFEAHIMVATAVSRLAARRATDAQIEQLGAAKKAVEDAIAARDYFAMASTNAQLHRFEAAVANSSHIYAAAASIHDHGQRLAYLCYGGGSPRDDATLDAHLRQVTRHHDEMFDAVTRHDPDAAVEIARAHVQLFRSRVQRFLEDGLHDYTLVDDDLFATLR
jgi:DNA-binding GntR family transcriptional regulator